MNVALRQSLDLFACLRPCRLYPGIPSPYGSVDPAYEGRGIGSLLAKDSLDDVRSKGLRVVARCPFVARYIEEHPEYAKLVSED